MCWPIRLCDCPTGNRRLLWHPMVHCRVHKNPPGFPFLSHINSVHTLIPYCLKIHFNIILPYTSKSRKWSISFRFYDRNFISIFHILYACWMRLPFHFPAEYPNKRGDEYKCNSSLYSFLLKSKCSPQHPVLKKTLLFSSPNVRDHVSHLY
jgi:hypothetical protein